MDLLLAQRLENDEEFRRKICTMVSGYVKTGQQSVAYWIPEFDAAHDAFMCYAMMRRSELDNLDKGHPKKFLLPVIATQISTMTTFVAQMLYGTETPHKVEGRGPNDEDNAEKINNLLRWNAEQQPTYLLGYLWIQDALLFNRGVFYNSWAPIFRPTLQPEDVTIPNSVDPATGQPNTYVRWSRKNAVIGGYARTDLVSPYDWFCDPQFPLSRFQEGRFAGHRMTLAWQELKRRSGLDPSAPTYVSPWAVEALKKKKDAVESNLASTLPTASGSSSSVSGDLVSRTQYERTRAASPVGVQKADDKDPGVISCVELWVRLVPADYEIYGPGVGTEPVVFQIIVAGTDTVLSMTESTYAHGQYPYSVGEARPSAHFQYSPSWALVLKGLQDHIDWLKNRHQDALSRTMGNVFVIDPAKVEIEDFLNPEKEGLIIPLKRDAAGADIRNVVQQIPIKDLTERFPDEMSSFVAYSASVTGVNSSMQGVMSPDENSATEYAGTQQMAAGRLASVARLLSVQGIVPQTRQVVSMFQQFLSAPQAVRYIPTGWPIRPPFRGVKSLVIERDSIQGEFDYIAHDGTLPGTDARRVAAITRLIESAQVFPQVFAPAPGNIDPRQLIYAGAKAVGLNPELFAFTPESLAQAAEMQPVAAGSAMLPPGPPGQPGPVPQGMPLPPPELPALGNVGPQQPRPETASLSAGI